MKAIYPVDFVNAAVWFLSRQCFERVGLFNPVFFQYGEDDEFVRRVNYHGLEVGVTPKFSAVHDREQSPVDFGDRKFPLMKRAEILNHFSDINKSLPKSILLGLYSAFLPPAPLFQRFPRGLLNYIDQLWFAFAKLGRSLANKRIAALGGDCFFKETMRDIENYLLAK